MKKIVDLGDLLNLPGKLAVFGVGCSGIIVLSWMAFSGSTSAEEGFVPAYPIVSEPLLEQVIEDNYSRASAEAKLDKKSVLVQTVPIQGGNQLFIFDLNTPNSCGRQGCLYVVYTGDGKRVLSLYLRRSLPEDYPLFAVEKSSYGNEFPCLVVSQVEKNAVVSNRFCFSQGSFLPVNRQRQSRENSN
ncbi:hypothetical protein [Coleofasciculus sp. E2-BRE-01]|jgi:hypothetical protein|uniref:hypothetical protein n=1 Tax=Coleofasciculus sp. E2-BRE-01 TaxID=3069524 RepID=UPI0032F5574B